MSKNNIPYFNMLFNNIGNTLTKVRYVTVNNKYHVTLT